MQRAHWDLGDIVPARVKTTHYMGLVETLEPPAQSADIVLSLFFFFLSALSPSCVLSSSLPPFAPHPPHPPKPLSPQSPLSVSLSPSCPRPSTEKGYPNSNLSTVSLSCHFSLSLSLCLSVSLFLSLCLSLSRRRSLCLSLSLFL